MTILKLRARCGFRTHFQRLRDRGLLTMDEIAKRLGVVPCMVKGWRNRGLLVAHRYNGKGQCLYEPPPDDLPGKFKKKKPYFLAKSISLDSDLRGVPLRTFESANGNDRVEHDDEMNCFTRRGRTTHR